MLGGDIESSAASKAGLIDALRAARYYLRRELLDVMPSPQFGYRPIEWPCRFAN